MFPFLSPARNDIRGVFEEVRKAQKEPPHVSAMSGGFFDDLFGDVVDGVTGLYDAVSGALQSTLDALAHIGESIALIVRACFGDVSWSEVFDELGAVFRDVGSVMVFLNPARMTSDFLSQSAIAGHAFNELDRFTGGMITSATNISDLPWRAMRGDPISKQELIKDALFVIQVAAIIFTGPVGVGIMLGTMVGREVCSKQTEARDACMVAFQIVGAAAGSWAGAASGLTWGTAADTAQAFAEEGSLSAAEEAAWLAGDEAYKQFVQQQAQQLALQSSTSFLTHLAAAGQQYATTVGMTEATRQAARLCQTADLMGANECRIIAQVAANYVQSEMNNEPWEDFLAREVARIGAEQLMLQWFPADSKEAQAIKKQWQIKYVDVPVDQTVVVQRKIDPKAFLLAAGGVALLLFGAGS